MADKITRWRRASIAVIFIAFMIMSAATGRTAAAGFFAIGTLVMFLLSLPG